MSYWAGGKLFSLDSGNTLTVREQAVSYSGDRRVDWLVQEHDPLGNLVQRRRYDSEAPALAWCEQVGGREAT